MTSIASIKKAELQRIDAFELWCWRRILRVPWTARSNQSVLNEINLEYLLEGLMPKLKLQYFGHLMWRADSLEKTDAGKDWGQEEKGATEDEMVGWYHWLMYMSLYKLLKILKDREACHAAVHGVTKNQTWLSDWTVATIWLFQVICPLLLHFRIFSLFLLLLMWAFPPRKEVNVPCHWCLPENDH